MNARGEDGGRHLDELALDAVRAGEGSPESAAHAEGCARCRAALAGLARLEAGLKGAQPPLPGVPQDLERRIFRAYRESVGRRAPVGFPWAARRWALPAAGLAAAAAAVITLRVAPVEQPRRAQTSRPGPTASGRTVDATRDPIRASGAAPHAAVAETLEAPPPAAAVDIVDAFRLARALRDGRRVASDWDSDRSGAVDAADVAAFARRAVAL